MDHQPAHAGLYRGIRDFATTLGGKVLSFDGAAIRNKSGRDLGNHAVEVIRVQAGRGWLAKRVYCVESSADREADAAMAAGELLVVHSLFRGHAPWAHDWATRHRKPYWVVPHGCLDPAGLGRRMLAKRLWLSHFAGQLFGDATAMIFATKREQAKAARWITGSSAGCGCGDDGRSVIIPWPVPQPSRVEEDVARERFRLQHGIPDSATVLLFVGRLHSSKRPVQAIESFLAAELPRAHLVMVGMDGDLTRAQLQSRIPHSAGDRVHVVGELNGRGLADAWLASDGYISLSVKENFGYTAADALAYGMPVILSRGHDLAYELPQRAAGGLAFGWLLPNDSRQAAVEAICEWYSMVTRGGCAAKNLADLRDGSRAWVADNLSRERFQSLLRDLATRCT